MVTAKKTRRPSRNKPSSTTSIAHHERKGIGLKTKTIVLTEAGYRCANPICRQILALDLHHLYQVSEGGGNGPENLIALCPTCHALYHRGTIHAESIYAWKSMLISLGRAFDVEGIDRLLFLRPLKKNDLIVSGDGLLQFGRLIAAGLAEFRQTANNKFLIVTYSIRISDKGRMLVDAWLTGKRAELSKVLSLSAASPQGK
jgi:hypothetical protein